MSLEVHSLASGSSGNAMLLKQGGDAILVDAGLTARALADALRRRGIHAGALHAVLLTHEHDDHLRGAGILSRNMGAPVVANDATLEAAAARTDLRDTRVLPTGEVTTFGPFVVRSFPVSHDAAEAVGYVITAGGQRVAYATDIGCPSGALRDAMRGAGLCILESNHDREWLWRGPYPEAMKERISGPRGHLSNGEAAELIAGRLEEGGPAAFWLAHLSRVNNSPSLALRFARDAVAARTRVPGLIEVALRDRPSLVWRAQQALQLPLF